MCMCIFFFKQKTAYEMRISDWSSDVCSSDLALLLGRDVTLERSLRAALVESRQRYKDLVEISNDFAWETDGEGRFAFVSPRGALGYPATTLVGRSSHELLPDPSVGGDAASSPFTARCVGEEAELWVGSAFG